MTKEGQIKMSTLDGTMERQIEAIIISFNNTDNDTDGDS